MPYSPASGYSQVSCPARQKTSGGNPGSVRYSSVGDSVQVNQSVQTHTSSQKLGEYARLHGSEAVKANTQPRTITQSDGGYARLRGDQQPRRASGIIRAGSEIRQEDIYVRRNVMPVIHRFVCVVSVICLSYIF